MASAANLGTQAQSSGSGDEQALTIDVLEVCLFVMTFKWDSSMLQAKI